MHHYTATDLHRWLTEWRHQIERVQHMAATRDFLNGFSSQSSSGQRKLFRARLMSNSAPNKKNDIEMERVKVFGENSSSFFFYFSLIRISSLAVYRKLFGPSVSRRDAMHEFTIYQNDKSIDKRKKGFAESNQISLIHLPVVAIWREVCCRSFRWIANPFLTNGMQWRANALAMRRHIQN